MPRFVTVKRLFTVLQPGGLLPVALLGLLAALSISVARPVSASAAGPSATYHYLIGTGFLCTLGPDVCPDIAMAPNGDMVEITGAGTLGVHPKSVTGGGTFKHKNAAGAVLGMGTWSAEELISFKSFGQNGTFPAGFSGGVARILIHLSPGFDAILEVDCDLHTNPPGHEEGVRLNVPGVIHFNKKVSGGNIFILI